MQRFKFSTYYDGRGYSRAEMLQVDDGAYVSFDDAVAEASRMYDAGFAAGRVVGQGMDGSVAGKAVPSPATHFTQVQLGAKTHPITSGLLDYAPNAIAAIAAHSKYGNDKHNGAGSPLRWSFKRSTHHADAVATHLLQRGTIDPETGKSHSIALAWRAIMLLETELIAAGAVPGRAVSFEEP